MKNILITITFLTCGNLFAQETSGQLEELEKRQTQVIEKILPETLEGLIRQNSEGNTLLTNFNNFDLVSLNNLSEHLSKVNASFENLSKEKKFIAGESVKNFINEAKEFITKQRKENNENKSFLINVVGKQLYEAKIVIPKQIEGQREKLQITEKRLGEIERSKTIDPVTRVQQSIAAQENIININKAIENLNTKIKNADSEANIKINGLKKIFPDSKIAVQNATGFLHRIEPIIKKISTISDATAKLLEQNPVTSKLIASIDLVRRDWFTLQNRKNFTHNNLFLLQEEQLKRVNKKQVDYITSSVISEFQKYYDETFKLWENVIDETGNILAALNKKTPEEWGKAMSEKLSLDTGFKKSITDQEKWLSKVISIGTGIGSGLSNVEMAIKEAKTAPKPWYFGLVPGR